MTNRSQHRLFSGLQTVRCRPEMRGGQLGYELVNAQGELEWVSKTTFELRYHSHSRLPFGVAMELMRDGHRVRRESWRHPTTHLRLAERIHPQQPREQYIAYNYPWAESRHESVWMPAHPDILAKDWTVLAPE